MASNAEEQRAKQQQLLVKGLCDGVEARLEPKFATQSTSLASILTMITQLTVTVAAIESRLVILENSVAGAAVAPASRPKRATKTEGGKTAPAATKGAVKANGTKAAAATGDSYDKVKNGMLHFIYRFRVEPEFREAQTEALKDRFVDENQEAFAPEEYFEAIPGVALKTGDLKYNAIARHLWSSVLTEDEKKLMADEHKAKRQELDRKAEAPQCVEDADGGDA